jgi:hypothetical protein
MLPTHSPPSSPSSAADKPFCTFARRPAAIRSCRGWDPCAEQSCEHVCVNQEQPSAHVIFPLEVDEDGWPPVGSERVWAFDLGDGLYQVDNVPWFVRDLAVGDVVLAVATGPGTQPVFQRMHTRSDHLTIRLICFRGGPLGGQLQPVIDRFVPLGVYAEGALQYGMVALDIPPGSDLRAIREQLRAGAADGSWEWEEGRIDHAWVSAYAPARSRSWFRR